ncbi:hypothetical protein NDN08_004931 [Rhodosorus marinus]|uniref:Uncharacterized protein n=1 Tax=Rhodosorus marinus TaxID=101924 RepID=A0AAV8UF46_9RHOD|nr:hypothetical protein NDN08_004931 [Rhodosorus marinus]
MAGREAIRNVLNMMTFGIGVLDKNNIVRMKNVAEPGWEVTQKLRQQYIATSVERMPYRVSEFKKEFALLRERLNQLVKKPTVDPEQELVPLAWFSFSIFLTYMVGKVIGRRSLRFINVEPFYEDLDNPDRPRAH